MSTHVTASCASCPLAHEDDGRSQGGWYCRHPDGGFDLPRVFSEPPYPDKCPLRKSPLLIQLRKPTT